MTSIAGRAVMVTGASGSLGLALLGRLSQESPAEIRALQRSQTAAERLRAAVPSRVPLRVISADVADGDAVASAMEGAELVFHLAGLKDVLACEEDPRLAVRSNVSGSEAVVRAATRRGPHVVVVAASSDKAGHATSVLGHTKALMERIICAAKVGCSVRLGGILGSSGSVLEVWQRTARDRGVIEVTDPGSTRFVMSKDEAVSSLLRAYERGRAGEILIPTMRAYRLGDLADAFARINDVQVLIVGNRVGEEHHAEALTALESTYAVQEDQWRILVPGRRLGGVLPYRSDEAQRLTPTELEQIIGTAVST